MAVDEQYDVVVEHDVPMTTRDGVVLYADIYRPDAPGTFPVLVLRTPYDRTQHLYADGATPTLHMMHTREFPKHGYVVVSQDTRGRWSSEGEFVPYFPEPADGYDTVEWAAALPWSNGRVSFVGKSYMGLVQYLGAAEQPPSLQAMAPMSAPISYFENCVYRRGVFELGWQLSYIIGMARDQYLRDPGPESDRALAQLDGYLADPAVRFSRLKPEEYRHLPLADWGDRLREAAPYLAEFIEHAADGPYWQRVDVRRKADRITVPGLHVAAWFDPFLPDTTEMYARIRANARTEEEALAQRLIIGPWTHVYGTRVAGDVDFGPEAEWDMIELERRWYDHWLKDRDSGLLDDDPVRFFVMGANRWRTSSAWPPPEARTVEVLLASGGNANGAGGDGRLAFSAATGAVADRFVYDPEDPVPTRGGTTLLGLGDAAGVYDQREIEARADVLVYTSDPLDEAIEIAGPVSLRLFAATSAKDADFMAKLVDVHPDGTAHNVADGVVRARFRDSLEHPTPVEPGAVVEYELDLWSTAHWFAPGHRLRLDVTSSDFPRYDRNPGTGNPFGVDVELRVAEQTIFHDEQRPSRLLLPVVPEGS